MFTAEYLADKLNLAPHPEGGYYRETYRSASIIPSGVLGEEYSESRCTSTAIYFLLGQGDKSKFHRLKSDEAWIYNSGGSAEIFMLGKHGLKIEKIGPDINNGESFQVFIPKNVWFAAKVTRGDYLLITCTVAPGFEFNDFELAESQKLVNDFPDYRQIINELT